MGEPKPTYFDDYVENYESLVSDQTRFFSKDRGYFSWHKAEIMKRVWGDRPQPERILEFGCGIGLNLPYIAEAFPQSKTFGSDISEQSLDQARERYKSVTCLSDSELQGQQFNLILVSCVLHHVLPQEREEVMERVKNLLTPSGVVCIVEHNPYNPVTRWMVNTCPFDEDAVLLTMRETKKRIQSCNGLTFDQKGYCLFFPERFKALNTIEPAIGFLPLGGQYFVSAHRE